MGKLCTGGFATWTITQTSGPVAKKVVHYPDWRQTGSGVFHLYLRVALDLIVRVCEGFCLLFFFRPSHRRSHTCFCRRLSSLKRQEKSTGRSTCVFDVVVLNPGFALTVKIFGAAGQPSWLVCHDEILNLSDWRLEVSPCCSQVLVCSCTPGRFVTPDLWSDVVGGLGFPPKTQIMPPLLHTWDSTS
ncbi:unnamed protein product [Ectocarpus sp. 4 AP-2014]